MVFLNTYMYSNYNFYHWHRVWDWHTCTTWNLQIFTNLYKSSISRIIQCITTRGITLKTQRYYKNYGIISNTPYLFLHGHSVEGSTDHILVTFSSHVIPGNVIWNNNLICKFNLTHHAKNVKIRCLIVVSEAGSCSV